MEEPEKKVTDTKDEPVKPQKKEQEKPEKTATDEPEDTGIYFDDGFGTENGTPQKNDKKNKNNNDFDLEDEYYDLDGF